MYCTNCGRKLPEDGSPCICGAQNGNFNTQPTQNFQTPPQHYAQPPVQYPVQPPVRPVTPVHGMLKRFASSKLFFMCALLFTVQMVVSAVSSVIEVFTVLQNQAYLLERTPIGTNFNVEFSLISKQFLDLTLCNSANGGKACIYGLFRHLLYGRTIRI